MDRYTVTRQLGDGTFGSVLQAVDETSGLFVAIKRMKAPSHSWAEAKQLREISALKKVRHPNVVTLYEVIREKMMLYFVFEFLECNLYQVIKDRDKYLPETVVRNYSLQILQGLAYMHEQGYFHRDLKPENILVTGSVCKLADFGLAKEIGKKTEKMTEYVSTRWYRAPEVLLRDSEYGASIDIWAVGTIVAELLNLRPLFPGSSEIDQLYKIFALLGTPTQTSWAKGVALASHLNINLPFFPPISSIKMISPHSSDDAIELISLCLMYDSYRRPTARRAIALRWFLINPDMQSSIDYIQSNIDYFQSNIEYFQSNADAVQSRQAPSSVDISGFLETFVDSSEAVLSPARMGRRKEERGSLLRRMENSPFQVGYEGKIYEDYEQLVGNDDGVDRVQVDCFTNENSNENATRSNRMRPTSHVRGRENYDALGRKRY